MGDAAAGQQEGHRLLAQLEGVLDEASSRLTACLELLRLDQVDAVPQQRAREAVEQTEGPSREEFRQRLRALDERVAQACAAGDLLEQAQALAEREAMWDGLARSLGLRHRPLAAHDGASAMARDVRSPAG